ncbi:MAG: iron-containing alcohol dehydrogenase [Chloroflexi bacterium]|nr:iron-containing alcohol dehydrogenase [Chloroflexota bacterium]
MKILKCPTGHNRYINVYYGNNILHQLEGLARELDADKFFIITDSGVPQTIKDEVKDILSCVVDTHLLEVPYGEESKCFGIIEKLGGQILDMMATKSSVVVCLGGGVVGNMGGLLAALLFRGIRFFHIPTTMVAQIDSSIGQKQAINYKMGKNMFGQYYPPQFVFVDFNFLRSLSMRHIRAGMAESVKHGLCQSEAFFEQINAVAPNFSDKDIDEISLTTIELKLELMEIDPYEGKLDPQLELGHTIGHAVEIIKYGSLLHGEAIAIGMTAETKISVALGYMKPELPKRIEALFEKIGLPTKIPAEITIDQIFETLKYDNKRRATPTKFFLLEDFTRFHTDAEGKIGDLVAPQTVREVLESCY